MGEAERALQVEEWAQRIEATGLTPVLLPLLELARPLGFLMSQILLLGEPLLDGISSRGTVQKAAVWLEDPDLVDQLLTRLAQ